MIRQLLIKALEELPLLDDRYESIKCININAAGEKLGYFSLVFKCFDRIEQRPVVLKFFDPDQLGQAYRIDCFKREPQILKTLVSKTRCLQLLRGLKEFKFQIPGSPVELTFEYFVLEWLSEGVEHYFKRQQQYDAETKLRLFADVVLAIELLHQNNVFHRDGKPDNFRAYQEELKRIVVAIDLGTAARYETGALRADYSALPAGAISYSAPEAICGLAGVRNLAKYTDSYALGCMLYELFNVDLFGTRVHSNGVYRAVLAFLNHEVGKGHDDSERATIWLNKATQFRHSIEWPGIDDSDSTVPVSISTELNQVLRKLIAFDLQERTVDYTWVRQRIWGAITVLNNAKAQANRIERKRREREARLEKARRKDERVRKLGEQGRLGIC